MQGENQEERSYVEPGADGDGEGGAVTESRRDGTATG